MSKGPRPDAGDTITNRDAGQTRALPKGRTTDAGDAVRNCDTGQTRAAKEGLPPMLAGITSSPVASGLHSVMMVASSPTV
ncbi:hypothetical protein OAG39_00105 [Verrucomicrobiales bacterium]|nr:hypothetical protein [Verrucomicrobiales bacterium]